MWKHLVTVSSAVVKQVTANESAARQLAANTDSDEIPFDLLAARELIDELGDDAMTLPVTFLGFVRLASNALRDDMRRTPAIGAHIRDVVKCVMKNVDAFLKPSLVKRVGSFLMNDDDANQSDEQLETHMSVLFPGNNDNAVGMDRALWFTSLRANVVYRLLHEVYLDTPHAVVSTYSSHVEDCGSECAAKDSMYPSFQKRLTFWTSLWTSLGSRIGALKALSTAHEVVTGVPSEPPAEVTGQPEPELPKAAVAATHETLQDQES